MVRRRSTVRFRNGAPLKDQVRSSLDRSHPTLWMGAVAVLGGIWEIVFFQADGAGRVGLDLPALFTSHGGTRIMIDAITAITADEIAQGRKGDGWRDGADARRVGRADAGGTGGAEAGLHPGTRGGICGGYAESYVKGMREALADRGLEPSARCRRITMRSTAMAKSTRAT